MKEKVVGSAQGVMELRVNDAQRCLMRLSHLGKVVRYTRIICRNVENVLLYMLIMLFPRKYCAPVAHCSVERALDF